MPSNYDQWRNHSIKPLFETRRQWYLIDILVLCSSNKRNCSIFPLFLIVLMRWINPWLPLGLVPRANHDILLTWYLSSGFALTIAPYPHYISWWFCWCSFVDSLLPWWLWMRCSKVFRKKISTNWWNADEENMMKKVTILSTFFFDVRTVKAGIIWTYNVIVEEEHTS